MSQSGGKSGAVRRRFSERHAICSPPPLGSCQSTFDCSFIFSPPLLPSFYLFRSLSPPATYIERSCPYMALANIWPGRHKVIVEGFSLLCSCASCTTAQTGPFQRTSKRALLASPVSPLDCHLSLLSVFILQVGWHRFLFIFLNGTGSYANTLGKYEKSSLFFVVSQCPDLWLSVDA